MLRRAFRFHTWVRVVRIAAIIAAREARNSPDTGEDERAEIKAFARFFRDGPRALNVKTVMAAGGAMRSTKSRKAFVPFDWEEFTLEKKRKGKARQKKITPPMAKTQPTASVRDVFTVAFLFSFFRK